MDLIFYQITAILRGLSPIMFDKFKDHSSPNLPMEQKIYVQDGYLVLPQANLFSFLEGEIPGGIVKVDKKKKYREFLPIIKSHIGFSAPAFRFRGDGDQEIVFNGFADTTKWGVCEEGGMSKMSGGKIVKQEVRPRPYLKLPWSLPIGIKLTMSDFNTVINPDLLQDWFIKGGILVGLGTYRPRYGRFEVLDWQVT